MALTKVRGFNRGRTYNDLRQLAGGASMVPTGAFSIAGVYAAPGHGTPWSSASTGSLQRGYGYVTTTYPAANNNDNAQYAIYLEDMGLLQDFYTSGGFCVSMKVRYQDRVWQALGSDGTNFLCANTTVSSATTPDLVNYTSVTNTGVGQNVGYANGRVQWVNGTIIASSGSQYITQADAPGGTWTTLTSAAGQGNMSFTGAVFRGGQYYLYGWTSGFGGAVLRTSGTTWNLATGTMVYQAGNTLNAVEHMDWFDDVGCFLGACTRNRANAAAQAGVVRSVDGTTWADAYTSSTSTTGLMSVATNGAGTAVAVGYNGFIVISTNGSGTSWTPVSSGQTTQRFTSVRWYNGEFVAVTQQGGTSTSPDGLTWTWTDAAQTLNFGGGVGMELFIHSDGLYSYLRGAASQMIVQKYMGGRQWETVNFFYNGLTNNVSNPSTPAGVFFGDPVNTATGFIGQGNNMAGMHQTASGIYPVDGVSNSMWTFGAQTGVGYDQAWHRISVEGTSVPGQAVPTFTFKMYLDGNPITSSAVSRAAFHAGQKLYVCSSSSSWNMMCDVVVTNFTGPRNVGLTGDMQIRPRALTTDVGTPEWERVPVGAASNAVAAQGNGSVLYAESSVQSSGTTDTDVYAGGIQPPIAGFKIAAVNVSATFQRLGIPTPTVELSVTEGGSSLPAQSATLTGTTTENVVLTALYPTKLDDGIWTPETVTSADVQIKRIS